MTINVGLLKINVEIINIELYYFVDRECLQSLQLRCLLTAELIESVDRILFYPNTSKVLDELILKTAQV